MFNNTIYISGWRRTGLGPDWGTGRQGLPCGPGERWTFHSPPPSTTQLDVAIQSDNKNRIADKQDIACVSPTQHVSTPYLVVQASQTPYPNTTLKRGNAIEIYNAKMFTFYLGLLCM